MNKFRKTFDHKMWFYDLAKITGGLSSAIYLRMKRIYENGKKPKGIFKGKFIVCPNHNSYLDPIKVMHSIPSRRVTFMATKTIFKNKFVSWMFKRFGCVKVEGTNVDSFKQAINTLNRGHIVTIFPEAHVVPNTNIREYKSGMAMMAVLADADLLPIYVGKRKHWTRREIVVIGNKIDYKEYISGPFPTLDEIEQITQAVHNKELELKKIYDKYIEEKYHLKDIKLEKRKAKKAARIEKRLAKKANKLEKQRAKKSFRALTKKGEKTWN